MAPSTPQSPKTSGTSQSAFDEFNGIQLQCGDMGLWSIVDGGVAAQSLVISGKLADMQAKDPQFLQEFLDSTVTKEEGIVTQGSHFVPLLPFKTPSDHNCLCHSVPIALWGMQDTEYVVRKAILQNMEGESDAAQYFREQWMHVTLERDQLAFGTEIERSSEQWVEEWNQELKLLRDTNCSLTEIHVFVLAHVVRRPIIVYSPGFQKDVNGEDMAPIYFGGIYLPVLLAADNCASQCPALVAYCQSHFTALIPMETDVTQPLIAPLVDAKGNYLPIHYVDQNLFSPGGTGWKELLAKYIMIAEHGEPTQMAVQLTTSCHSLPQRLKVLQQQCLRSPVVTSARIRPTPLTLSTHEVPEEDETSTALSSCSASPCSPTLPVVPQSRSLGVDNSPNSPLLPRANTISFTASYGSDKQGNGSFTEKHGHPSSYATQSPRRKAPLLSPTLLNKSQNATTNSFRGSPKALAPPSNGSFARKAPNPSSNTSSPTHPIQNHGCSPVHMSKSTSFYRSPSPHLSLTPSSSFIRSPSPQASSNAPASPLHNVGHHGTPLQAGAHSFCRATTTQPTSLPQRSSPMRPTASPKPLRRPSDPALPLQMPAIPCRTRTSPGPGSPPPYSPTTNLLGRSPTKAEAPTSPTKSRPLGAASNAVRNSPMRPAFPRTNSEMPGRSAMPARGSPMRSAKRHSLEEGSWPQPQSPLIVSRAV